MKKLIRSNNKGKLLYDIHSNTFCIEFGNVEFNLTMDDYLSFEKNLKELSKDLSLLSASDKLRLPIMDTGIILVMNTEDILGLRDLLGFKSEKLLSFKMRINYSMN